MAPKWQGFHSSLAGMLNLTLALVDQGGNIRATYNPQPPFTLLDSYPNLATSYQRIFKDFLDNEQEISIMPGPLGHLLAGIPLQNCLLVICGGLERDPAAQEKLRNGMQKYGITSAQADFDFFWGTYEEVETKVDSVRILYTKIINSIAESSDYGQEGILLAALDEINSLMVGLLNPETFDLKRILDLVASSMIILLDAQSAWVFSQYLDRFETVILGNKSVALEEAGASWGKAVNNGLAPFSVHSQLRNKFKSSFLIQKPGSILSLGVHEPREDNVDSVLSAFGKQVAIAVEMDSLYNVLQRRIGQLLNSIRHGMIVTNRDGIILVANRAARKVMSSLGLSPNLGITLGKELCPEIEKAVAGAARGLTFFRKQSLLTHDDNSVHLSWDAAPITGNNDEILGVILLFEDMTETMTLTRQLKEWERLATAGEVAAGLAHEIRNPLAAARGALQLFEMVDSEQQRDELLARFSQELDRVNSILSEYLSLTTPGGDEITLIDLSEVLNEIRFLLRSEAILYNVEMQVDLNSNGSPMVLANSGSLKQVFLNIGKNALEAMVNGGRLTVSLGRDATHAWVEFTDTGPGIPLEHQDNIFNPFFTTKVGGTGLGLAISSRIIKRLDGEIKIHSAPGTGTTVTVFLPVQRVKEETN